MPKQKIKQSYVICASPRTGSTLLIHALGDTNLCGKPNEFFIRRLMRKKANQWGIPDDDFLKYLEQLFRRTATPNGVFGFKLMHTAYQRTIRDLQEISNIYNQSERDLMEQYFPNLQYIYITRKDKIRQAISIVKAQQSNVWHSTQTDRQAKSGELIFDKLQIDDTVNEIIESEAAWEDTFRENNLEPYRIVYEDFSVSYKSTILDVMEYLSIPIQSHEINEKPVLKKLADNTSERWYVQCLRDIGELSEESYFQHLAEINSDS